VFQLDQNSTISIPKLQDCQKLAIEIAKQTQHKDLFIIYLSGDLGTGKTTFSQYFIRALTKIESPIKSPTYTIIESYAFQKHKIYHLDLYRIHTPSEIEQLGLKDLLADNAHWLIEWPEKGCNFLPKPHLHLIFSENDDGQNQVQCLGMSK
jgi:tRNA threonylcarbamoyladenosine biosynthesis protein TsaE